MKTKIKSFEDACKAENIDPTILPEVSGLPEHLQEKQVANYKLDVINQALNNEEQEKPWLADYSDYTQDKFEPYFRFSPVSGWSLYDLVLWYSSSDAGARRNYRTREIAKYAATQFIDLYSKIL